MPTHNNLVVYKLTTPANTSRIPLIRKCYYGISKPARPARLLMKKLNNFQLEYKVQSAMHSEENVNRFEIYYRFVYCVTCLAVSI